MKCTQQQVIKGENTHKSGQIGVKKLLEFELWHRVGELHDAIHDIRVPIGYCQFQRGLSVCIHCEQGSATLRQPLKQATKQAAQKFKNKKESRTKHRTTASPQNKLSVIKYFHCINLVILTSRNGSSTWNLETTLLGNESSNVKTLINH